ncbi:hypothetical protein BD779DRAFT_1536424 [Infundibulicybe gibba]|nr:hypothetical protein BD779DRAFT_1536424 [Infundibulicybe gibba]
MTDQKPLPAVPTSHVLSIPARAHQSQVIRHLLFDVQESELDRKREEWASSLEHALDNLGESIAYGGWLQGVRETGVHAGHAQFPERREKTPPTDRRFSLDDKDKALEDVSSSGSEGSRSNALEHLRKLASEAEGSMPSTSEPSEGHLHLLLSLTPAGSLEPNLPGERDLTTMLLPAGIGCVFQKGIFSIPDNDAEVSDIILHGFPEVESAARLVGGTLHSFLREILRVAIYLHLSLLLEQHLLTILAFPSNIPGQSFLPLFNFTSLIPSGIYSLFSRKSFTHREISPGSILGRGGSLDLGITLNNADDNRPSSMDGNPTRARRFSFISDRRPSFRKPPQDKDNRSQPFNSALRREKRKPDSRLQGDEKVGLSSILGWDGLDSFGRGMSGMPGFVRQQELSILFSQHTPYLAVPQPEAIAPSEPPMLVTPCGRPRLITYRHYSSNPLEDKTLYNMISGLVTTAQEPCTREGCQFKCGEHELRFIHGSLRIAINYCRNDVEPSGRNANSCIVWQSCAICGCESSYTEMSKGTRLFSFSKFLELLVYSPVLCVLPDFCEHTSPPPKPWKELPNSRLNIIRHFSLNRWIISFKLNVEDIFELRVPRLQIIRSGDRTSRGSTNTETGIQELGGAEHKQVRREIKRWWEGVSDHIDHLESILGANDLKAFHKALPRLPSEDDDDMNEYFPITSSTTHTTPPLMQNQDPAQLLSNLRHNFQRAEQALYSQLSQTPTSSLNEVRRSFLSSAQGARRRLLAWQNKHLPAVGKVDLGQKMRIDEPEWWKKGCHAVPGANVIVREDDWGSIISFTLGTADYNRELLNMSIARIQHPTESSASSPSSQASHSSFFATTTGYRLFTSSTYKQPDPDQKTRKEHPRDPTSLLSLREVLRQKSPLDLSSGLPLSRFGTIGSSTPRLASGTPPSAWAKPDVQISKYAADGEVSGLPEAAESAGKILQDFGLGSGELSRPSSVMSGSSTSSSGFDAHIRRGKSSSIISVESDMTIGPEARVDARSPTPPPKDGSDSQQRESNISSGPSESRSTTSSFTTTLSSSLNVAMRYVLNTPEKTRTSPMSKNHHGLLTPEATHIDERPHIKYDWTIGKRLKFSCTVYYAKQFDILRRRCGIDDIFLKSLSRSTNWAAEGGKSKSNFWKTSDDRFIIKTLVNAWNVADLQVLIELAPSYFRYMDTSANKATVLAKLIGFYTIEIRNLETGTIQSKADLLVMENLFYERSIVKTFDLKGIQGRKVKASTSSAAQNPRTLFDGEWIEGQQRTLMLVRPHSKCVLREAIKNDAEFLSKSNIMDYSLLLGVDEEHKQIVCGLVDTIGSYTFAKTLEYKAKQGLNSGKATTVIPPAEYQERFVNTLEGYFLACPGASNSAAACVWAERKLDKWSKPLDESLIISDPKFLPSVL